MRSAARLCRSALAGRFLAHRGSACHRALATGGAAAGAGGGEGGSGAAAAAPAAPAASAASAAAPRLDRLPGDLADSLLILPMPKLSPEMQVGGRTAAPRY
jgi:hypothetical protein